MSMGTMMAMRTRRGGESGQRNDRRYGSDSGRNESPRNEYDGGIYDYDRWRYDDGRFAPKEHGHRTRAEMGGEVPYDSFYDRDGRRHYDNGRYAPMRSAYNGGAAYDMIGFDINSPSSRGRGGAYDIYPGIIYNHHEGYTDEERRKLEERKRRKEAGHASSDYDEDEDEYFFKVKGKFGRKDGMDMYGGREMPRKMTREIAEEWTSHMRNEDGSKGPHWSMEQVKQIMEQKKELQEFGLPDVFAAMNMMYSDYCEVAKKFGVSNMDFYVAMTKAWLDDEDAGAGDAKTLMYYECVAK